MSEKKTPILRFKGFTDDWEQRKVGEFYSFKNGLNKEKEFFGRGVPIVNFTDVFHNRAINVKNLKGKVDLTPKEISNFRVQKGDIFFTRTSEIIEEIGYPSVMLNDSNDTVFSGFVLRARAHGDDPLSLNFKSYVFFTEAFRNEMIKKSSMTTRALTSGTAIKEMLFHFPVSKDEQTKIGNLFKNLDEAIALHQRKLEKLNMLKKAYSQQLFPQADEKIPKLRFLNYNMDWEWRKLGECFSERNERTAHGELISVTISSGVVKASSLERKDNSSKDKSNYKKVEVGDIAYNSMRMWQGASGVSNFTGILSPAYTVIIPKEEISSIFFSYMFKVSKMIQIFQTNSQGLTSDTWNLKYPLLKDIKVIIPNYQEQAKVGNYFKQLDETIALHQDKLEKLKILKKVYLQKMFI